MWTGHMIASALMAAAYSANMKATPRWPLHLHKAGSGLTATLLLTSFAVTVAV